MLSSQSSPPIFHDAKKLKKPSSFTNKLFLCLRPLVTDDSFAYPKGTENTPSRPVLKFIHMERQEGTLFPHVYPRSSPPENDPAGDMHTTKCKRKFLRAVKAVFFETSLANKIKKRTSMKKKKHCYRDSTEVDKDLNLVKEKLLHQRFSKKTDHVPCRNSSVISSSVSSTNNSKRFSEKELVKFGSLNSIIIVENNKKKQENLQDCNDRNGKGNYGSNTGLFLLLITLLVLVLWGKVLAILCTSAWLFFMPNLSNISGKKLMKNGKVGSQISMDMKDYKKKVIMEGLLERNRT